MTAPSAEDARRLVPMVPAALPRRRSVLRRTIGRLLLRLLGWRTEGRLPDASRFVAIVAPHTSNWDFVVGFAFYLAIEIDASWLGKHTLFRWPFGGLLRYFGGIPVHRERASNVVELHIDEFRRRERLVFAIAPEGTRRRTQEWKSGFHRIASGAGVPIFPLALDYSTRTIRLFPVLMPGADYAADLRQLQALYHPAMARFPANY